MKTQLVEVEHWPRVHPLTVSDPYRTFRMGCWPHLSHATGRRKHTTRKESKVSTYAEFQFVLKGQLVMLISSLITRICHRILDCPKAFWHRKVDPGLPMKWRANALLNLNNSYFQLSFECWLAPSAHCTSIQFASQGPTFIFSLPDVEDFNPQQSCMFIFIFTKIYAYTFICIISTEKRIPSVGTFWKIK